MKKNLAKLIILTATIVATACGVEPGTSQNSVLTDQPVGIRFEASASSAQPAPVYDAAAVDENAELTLAEAVLNVGSIELKLPDEVDCKAYDGDGIDDEDEAEAEDQGSEEIESEDEDPEELHAAPEAEDADDEKSEDDESDDDGNESEARLADCDQDELRFEGPFRVNLIDGTSQPSLESLGIPAGSYNEIKIKIEDAESETKDDPMEDITLRASGQYSDSSTSFAFTMALKFDEEIKIKPENDIVIDQAGDEDIVIRFPVENWIAGVDIAACHTSQSNGDVLSIDERQSGGECGELENQIKDNFKNSVESDEDDDHEESADQEQQDAENDE